MTFLSLVLLFSGYIGKALSPLPPHCDQSSCLTHHGITTVVFEFTRESGTDPKVGANCTPLNIIARAFQIARFTGQHGAHLGPVGHRWAHVSPMNLAIRVVLVYHGPENRVIHVAPLIRWGKGVYTGMINVEQFLTFFTINVIFFSMKLVACSTYIWSVQWMLLTWCFYSPGSPQSVWVWRVSVNVCPWLILRALMGKFKSVWCNLYSLNTWRTRSFI